MHSRLVYGRHHKHLDTIVRSGFPSHLRGEVKDAIFSLIKKGFILWYHKADESIQLNKERYKEIEQLVKGTNNG
ncbi:hypothetical protein HYV89_00875 [Candidatus Woesearchaeota archaeon]|nr:hypothetical protein [Candidatus Woesearchaeota archaeon]